MQRKSSTVDMADISLVIKEWKDVERDDDDMSTWFAPGALVLVPELLHHGIDFQRLVKLPFAAVCMCVRDESLQTFHVDMLHRFGEDGSSLNALFSPWVDQLTPGLCAFCGFNADALIEDGLTKRHVKEVMRPLSWWSATLEFETRHWRKLRIKHPHRYFDDLDSELLNGQDTAALDFDV